jgi:hypothetical protein
MIEKGPTYPLSSRHKSRTLARGTTWCRAKEVRRRARHRRGLEWEPARGPRVKEARVGVGADACSAR